MQGSTRQLPKENYSSTRKTKKHKQRRSIFSVPEPVEPQRIRRIKNRRNMVRNYREKIRDIYHQTDYLVSFRDDELSCFIRPIEQTSNFAFFEKSTRSNYSTLSNNYSNKNTYSQYKNSTLPYNTTETLESPNTTENESTNLVSIPTGRFTNSLYKSQNENLNQNQYDLDPNKIQTQPELDNQAIEEYIPSDAEPNENQYQPELENNANEEYIPSDSNADESENQFQPDLEDIGNEVHPQPVFDHNEPNQPVEPNDDENEEYKQFNVSFDDDENHDQTIEQPINYTEFSAIQSKNQTENQNIDRKEEEQNHEILEEEEEDVDPNDEKNTESNINLSVTVVVYEEEEEELSFNDVNIEAIFVRVENLPLNSDNIPLFIAFQHYTADDKPIGLQDIIKLNQKDFSVLNFSNINRTDIIEALVFINDDEENPTLVSGIRLPVHCIDWSTQGLQFFDLISADDLRAGIDVPKGNAGRIAMAFKLL